MANIPLTGTGGLFPRLDSLFSLENYVISSYGTQLLSLVSNVWNQFPNSQNQAIVVANLLPATAQYQTVQQPYLSELTNEASNTLLQMANASVPLNPFSFNSAFALLNSQMLGSADTIQKPILTSTVTPNGSNVGDAVINTSTINANGVQLDMVFGETVTATVTNSANNGGTQFSEQVNYVGLQQYISTDYRWPGGSGCNINVNLIDANLTGNLIDGSFESWSGTTPNFWTIGLGAATVNKNAVNVVRGTYSFQITSDGSTLTQVYQNLANLRINTVYAFNIWCEMSALDASGQIRFRLTDSVGNTINNNAGTGQFKTVGMNGGSGIGTGFTQVQTFFQTPEFFPTNGIVRFEFAFTTAPSVGKIIYLDLLGFAPATQLYAGGPFIAGFSKATPSSINDNYSLVYTNNLGVHSNVRELDRWFNLRQLGVYLPTSITPTIPDNIT